MSHFTLGHKGVGAVQQKKWEEGVKLLTDALKGAKSPAWLLARAQAYQQSSKLDQALADAERAYLIASERQQPASRDQMILAQYRRAVILHKMGRFADSDACCLWSMQLAEGKNLRKEADTVANNVDDNGYYLATLESIKDTSQMPKTEGGAAALGQGKTTVAEWTRAYVWRSQALAALESLPAGDERRKLTVLRVPKEPVASEGADEGGHAGHGVPQAGARDTPTGNPRPRPVKRPDTALKVDFYQTLAAINLTIFIAGVDKEKLTVHFQDRRVTLANILVGEFTLPPTALQLEGSINPSACKYSVTPKKIELTLVKAEPAKWPTWGRQDEKKAGAQGPSGSEQSSISKEQLDSTACSSEPEKPTGTIHETAAAKSNDAPADKKRTLAPVYPTSSRSGPKDWDNIAAAEDDDDGKDVNQFFKQLYANSTPEQQRAMMKSFTESNGTALSTDWNDVKSRTVETHPPEGVEARKW